MIKQAINNLGNELYPSLRLLANWGFLLFAFFWYAVSGLYIIFAACVALPWIIGYIDKFITNNPPPGGLLAGLVFSLMVSTVRHIPGGSFI